MHNAARRVLLVATLAVVAAMVHAEDAVMAPLAARSLLLDITRAGDALVAVGERGHVLRSSDGERWQQSPVPTRAMLTGVHFADGELGWAVGHDAVILKTSDGGRTWRRVHYAPEQERPLLDVWFRDDRHGIAIGAYALLLVSDDGGESWQERLINEEDDFHLNQLAAAADGSLYIAAEAGLAYRSVDDGHTWESLSSPYEGSFFGVLAGPELLMFGLRGHLFALSSDGEQWRELPVEAQAMLTDAAELTDGRVVVVGLEGTVVIRSADTTRTVNLPDRRGLQAVVALSAFEVIGVGEGGIRRIDVDALGTD